MMSEVLSSPTSVNSVNASLSEIKGGWPIPIDGQTLYSRVSMHFADPATNTFTVYALEVASLSPSSNMRTWTVHKRYSDFEALHERLLKVYQSSILPHLPSKPLFGIGTMSPEFIAGRASALGNYMESLCAIAANTGGASYILLSEFLAPPPALGKDIENIVGNAARLPSKMTAALLTGYGDFNNIKISDCVELPDGGDCSKNNVLIRVISSSVNPVDIKVCNGKMEILLGTPTESDPFFPGLDLAGIVIRVGAACRRLKVGDEVYASTGVSYMGTFGQFHMLPESYCSLKPRNLSFEEAACVPTTGLTAYQALCPHVAPNPLLGPPDNSSKKKVVILGGSGGVGHMAVQIAHYWGCHVTATCSTSNVDFVKSVGADEVIDYSKNKWWEVLISRDIDLILDCVGGRNAWDCAPRVLRPGGHFITIVGDDVESKATVGSMAKLAGSLVKRGILSMVGDSPAYTLLITDASRFEDLDAVRDIILNRGLKPAIAATFSLSNIKDAYEMSQTGRTRGKIAITVSTPMSAEEDSINDTL